MSLFRVVELGYDLCGLNRHRAEQTGFDERIVFLPKPITAKGEPTSRARLTFSHPLVRLYILWDYRFEFIVAGSDFIYSGFALHSEEFHRLGFVSGFA